MVKEGHREYGLSCGTNKGHEFMSLRGLSP